MDFKRLIIRVDPASIALSSVKVEGDDAMILGVVNVSWTFDPEDKSGRVMLMLDASDVDFEVITRDSQE